RAPSDLSRSTASRGAKGARAMSNATDRPNPGGKGSPRGGDPWLMARYGVMALAVLVFLYLAWRGWTAYQTYQKVESHEFALADLPYNDVTKLAVDVRLDQARSFLSYNVLLLGVLWGLIVFRKEGPVIAWGDVPEGVVFVLANLAIGLNAWCYWLYMRLISALAGTAAKHSEGGMLSVPDFLDPRVGVFAQVQLVLGFASVSVYDVPKSPRI